MLTINNNEKNIRRVFNYYKINQKVVIKRRRQGKF